MERSQGQGTGEGVEITEVRRKLEEIPIKLDEARKRHIQARKTYLLAEAAYEDKYDMLYLSAKATSEKKTQGDLVALARHGSYEQRLTVITTEADMKVIENEIKYLSDQHEAALEDSRTARAEIKSTSFGG